MINDFRIIEVELDNDDGVLVTFSDETIAGYVVEELLSLRPYRDPVLGFPRAGPSSDA